MVKTRTSSKKFETGNTPPTNGRNVTPLVKDGANSPCSVAYIGQKMINDAVDTMSRKKKKDEEVIVPDKSKMDMERGKSEEKSSKLWVILLKEFHNIDMSNTY